MQLNDAQMRAIELMIEQQERLQDLKANRAGTRMDVVVREFYEKGNGGTFETIILDKIGRLLTPESTEDLNLEIVWTARKEGG